MPWIARLIALMALTTCTLATPSVAQDVSSGEVEEVKQSPLEEKAEQVVAYINGEKEAENVFASSFLKVLPPDQIKSFAQGLTDQFGPALSVHKLDPKTGTRASYDLRFERGIARGGIAIDPADDNKVSELVFRSVEPVPVEGDSIKEIRADLEALPGTISAYFGPLDGDMPALSLNADTPLALGSTFKFYVLAALGKQVADGERKWDDIVPLSTASFPSGMLQDYPEGAPITLHTYASMMISISDNTATDQLMLELGRDTVFETFKATAHATPELSAPFITTRELFLLKGGTKNRLETYANGTLEERENILEDRKSVV